MYVDVSDVFLPGYLPESLSKCLYTRHYDLWLFVGEAFQQLLLDNLLFLNLNVHEEDLDAAFLCLGAGSVQAFVHHTSDNLARRSENKHPDN